MSKRSPLSSRHLAAVALILCIGTGSAGALAQWGWRDSSGNVTYSDAPPPPGVPASDILRQPSSLMPPPAPAESNPATGESATSPAPAGPKSVADQEAQFRKRLAEQRKSQEKQAQEQMQTAQRADDCSRARAYRQTLGDGTPVLDSDANGNRSYLDDARRAAEMQRAQDVIAKNC